jgi:hypothetical protein
MRLGKVRISKLGVVERGTVKYSTLAVVFGCTDVTQSPSVGGTQKRFHYFYKSFHESRGEAVYMQNLVRKGL